LEGGVLPDPRAEHLPRRAVQDVGGRVYLGYLPPAGPVYLAVDRRAAPRRLADDGVNHDAPVLHHLCALGIPDSTLVALLTPTPGVAGCPVEYDVLAFEDL